MALKAFGDRNFAINLFWPTYIFQMLNAEQKKALNSKQLLELFHKYEDYSLLDD
jgi:hypothetical protein